jgi:aspartyl aminopeptidase
MSKSEKLYAAITNPVTKAMAQEFVDFVNEAVTPFHAVSVMRKMLEGKNFTALSEGVQWPALAPGGKYYITRNDSSIVAFTVGGKFKPGNGLKIAGAHTDSPNLALKPHPAIKKSGFHGVAIQPYGGGLWHTWFDRELTVAGRLLVLKKGSSVVTKSLVHIKKPLLRVPNLCIHLRDAADRNKLEPNKERHLLPLLSTEAVADAFQNAAKTSFGVEGGKDVSESYGPKNVLLRVLAEAAGCEIDEIMDFDLSIVDTQPATVAGLYDEFIMAPRIDNLNSCFCLMKGFLDTTPALIAEDNMVRVIAMFDHEECGSESSQGAGGSLIPDILNHLCPDAQQRSQTIANSFLMSVDCAHALHPNYSDKHEENHRPMLHDGPVIKYNCNQRYSTNGATGATVKALAKAADVPVQEFVVSNESPCGSTIGPILTALSGIKGADIGNPMLSMHSIREQSGTLDVYYMYRLMQSFFENYGRVKVDETML